MPETEGIKLETTADKDREVELISISKPKTNWVLIILLIIAVTGGITLHYSTKEEPKGSIRRKRVVEAFSYLDDEEQKLVKLGGVLPPGTGRIIPDEKHSWILCSPISGEVTKIFATSNMKISKGDILLNIHNPELIKQQKLIEFKTTNAQESLKYIDSRKLGPEFNSLNAKIAKAKAEFDELEQQVRLAKPFEGITIASAELSGLIKKKDSSEQMYKNQQAQLRLFYENLRIEKMNAQHNLKKFNAELEKIKYLTSQMVYRSPESGKIIEVFLKLGQYVNPGDKLVSIFDPKFVNVRLLMSYANYPQFSIGRKGRIFLEAEPHKSYSGIVISLRPIMVQPKNDFIVIIRIENPDYKVLIGCTARVEFLKTSN